MLSIDRNTIRGDGWEFIKVSDFSIFADFDCGDEDLNNFIFAHNDAALHKQELIAETYAFRFISSRLPKDKPMPPVAFASLLNDAVHLATNPQRRLVPQKIRRYSDYPAAKIGRLGVHKDYQGQDVGTLLLDVIKELFTTENRTGCRFITVDAYDIPRVLAFYEKNKFKRFPLPPTEKSAQADRDTHIMFFDLKRFAAGK
jgi:GNAT superfamily N-acetyltransferase